jgi:ADP-ribosyl-[dinitrogen reductase] hydrolase
MKSNRQLLEEPAASGGIQVRLGSPFSETPRPLPAGFDFGRIEGMLLGLAIGDALGNTSESLSPGARRKSFGEIRDYPRGTGHPSNDSQLAFRTLEQLVADGAFVPERVARRFSKDEIFGIGSTVDAALAALPDGSPWQSCGQPSAGNGALMRIAPILIPHLRTPSPALWADTALCAMITHNDSAAISSAVAFVAMLWELLSMDAPPAAPWWPSRFVTVLRELESQDYKPRTPHLAGFHGPLWKLLEQELPWACEKNPDLLDACNQWYSGAYLLETVPCVLYTLMRYANDPEEAIVRAVNDTHDKRYCCGNRGRSGRSAAWPGRPAEPMDRRPFRPHRRKRRRPHVPATRCRQEPVGLMPQAGYRPA